MKKKTLTVKELFEHARDLFSFELVNGIEEGPLDVTVTDIHRPGLALTGFMQNFLNERIQILGETEILFLNTRSEEEKRAAVERIAVTRQAQSEVVWVSYPHGSLYRCMRKECNKFLWDGVQGQ